MNVLYYMIISKLNLLNSLMMELKSFICENSFLGVHINRRKCTIQICDEYYIEDFRVEDVNIKTHYCIKQSEFRDWVSKKHNNNQW